MDVKVLGVERRRRWSKDEKARIIGETLIPGTVVCEVARRHGVPQSLIFAWRRQARSAEPAGRDDPFLLPVEVDAVEVTSSHEVAGQPHPRPGGRRTNPGVIEIELGSGRRVRVDNEVDADALRRVLSVLSEK
jgi:transposase